MRILLINQCHYRRGGADIVYLDTGKMLESKGHQVAYFSTTNTQNENTDFSVFFIKKQDLRKATFIEKVKNIKSYLYNKQAQKKLAQLILDFRPDVSNVHLFYSYISVSILETLKKFNVPVVYTVHDYRLLCPVNTLMDTKKQICEKCASGSPMNCLLNKCSEKSLSQSLMITLEALYWRRVKSPLDYIDHFHFVSKFCMQKYIEYLPEIEKKSSVHYNFSDVNKIESTDAKNYFLYYGRLSSQKGVLTLIEAWKEIPFNVKLKIVGTGDQMSMINNLILEYSLNNIEILGYKTGNELTHLIQNASFVIVPSEWYENNPMTIIESYHLGVPVIGANIGGIPEIIISEETGFIFVPKNSLSLKETILKANTICSSVYKKMSVNCEKFAKQYFSSESNYNYLLKIFEKVLKK